MPVPQALAAGGGLVASIHADALTATVDGVSVMLAWECRMSAYRTQYDMIIPISGEVPYLIAEGERPSFNGTFKRIDCASGHTDETGAVEMENQFSLLHRSPLEPLKEPIPRLFRSKPPARFHCPKRVQVCQGFRGKV
jgi:hypothetical protein